MVRGDRKLAAFNIDGHFICPVCYSRPDIDGRHRLDWKIEKPEKEEDRTVVIDGKEYSVIQVPYPCSNQSCGTVIVCKFINGPATVLPPWLDEYTLDGSALDEYENGIVIDGVWFEKPPEPGEEPVEEKTTAKVTQERDRMWVLISPGVFEHDIPSSWTTDEKGRIKTRYGTNKHRQIQEWFHKRGVTI